MYIFQFTGLSGSGKTTHANLLRSKLIELSYNAEIVDGDVYRKTVSRDLGFSIDDRIENISRLFSIAEKISKDNCIAILSIINPFEEVRKQHRLVANVRTVYFECSLETLIKRDPKGLYEKALLPTDNPDRIKNFTGISSPFEIPSTYDLKIETDTTSIKQTSETLLAFSLNCLKKQV
ncbi:adenylylsulfate kinase [Spirosomataceae bacterium TFI 002]|nr:adenylylsulfate kinase [Spirosomataceae bacterium TFI 002]